MAQQQQKKTSSDKVKAVLAMLDVDDEDALTPIYEALMKIIESAKAEAKAEAEAKAQSEAKAEVKAPKVKVVTKSKSKSGSGGKARLPSSNNNICSLVKLIKSNDARFNDISETKIVVTPTFSASAKKTADRYETYSEDLPAGTELTFRELITETYRLSGETNVLVNATLISAMLSAETRSELSEAFRTIVPLKQ